nr:hypothetical protein [Pseudohalioglobus sediminis]
MIRAEFRLFEELAAQAVGWELDFCQFSRATAPFFLEQVAGSSVVISRAVLPARFYQRGAVAPGYRTVSLLASGSGMISAPRLSTPGHWKPPSSNPESMCTANTTSAEATVIV